MAEQRIELARGRLEPGSALAWVADGASPCPVDWIEFTVRLPAKLEQAEAQRIRTAIQPAVIAGEVRLVAEIVPD